MVIFNNVDYILTWDVATTNTTYYWTGTANTSSTPTTMRPPERRRRPRITQEVEQDIQREDAAMAATVEQYDISPVAPVSGALMRKNVEGEEVVVLSRFDHWAGDETFLVLGDEAEHKADEWEVLTPAFHGYAYERACGMADSGYPGRLVSITGWNGINATVRRPGQSYTDQWASDHIAALAPLVNPTTETLEQTIERLTKAKTRLEEGLRARMVAHGVYRNWCAEFDPILDSSGLGPRKAKGWVHGMMAFRAEVTGDLTDPALIEKIKANPGKYVAWDKIKVETIEAEPAVNAPMLSI